MTERQKFDLVNRIGNLEPIGPVRIARFDPPWKPGFMRHNEVIIPIASK